MIKWIPCGTVILLLVITVNTFAQHQVPADGRFNFNVKYDVKGLDFILRLQPVSYQFDLKKFERRIAGTDASPALFNYHDEKVMMTRRLGFVAQDVEDAAQQSGFSFSGISKPSTRRDYYSLSYESFVIPLVKAIQEQHAIINNQENTLTQQQKRIEMLEKEISSLSEKLNQLLTILEEEEANKK